MKANPHLWLLCAFIAIVSLPIKVSSMSSSDSVRWFIQQSRFKEATDITQRFQRSGLISAEMSYCEGLAWKGLNRYTAAINSFAKSYRQDSLLTSNLTELGTCFRLLNNYNQSLLWYDKAWKKDSTSAVLWSEMAGTCMRQRCRLSTITVTLTPNLSLKIVSLTTSVRFGSKATTTNGALCVPTALKNASAPETLPTGKNLRNGPLRFPTPWCLLTWTSGSEFLGSLQGWQMAFIITGVLGFLWLIFWGLFYSSPKKMLEKGKIGQPEYDYIHSDKDEPKADEAAANHGQKISWGKMLTYRQTWSFVVGKFMLKAGAFRLIGKRFGLQKLHPDSHLYTSDTLHDGFPGKIFQIITAGALNKQSVKEALPAGKANVVVRNFPARPEEIRKKFGLHDGGENFLFATTLSDGQKKGIICRRV